MHHNYFRETDLNGPAGPITDPVAQPGALHYFGFEAGNIEIRNLGTERVLVSFDLAHDAGLGAASAPPPPQPRAHAVIDPGQDLPFPEHAHAHVLVWRDPTAPPPAGPEPVRVRAWS